MKRVGFAFALSAALLAFSSRRAPSQEPRWVAFSYGGEQEGYGAVFNHQPIEVAARQESPPDSAMLDEATIVALKEGSLSVAHRGEQVWHSDFSWDVRQFLLADVNNDGQEEVAFVLWKPYRLEPAILYETFHFPSLWEEDSLRNHLFIYGWRDGAWQELWCSSPVADPIVKVHCGDIDGDGSNELVVLEGYYAAPDSDRRHVSVWRWHGWGFTLAWRSPAGIYDDLLLEDVTGDGVPDILARVPAA